MDPLRRFARACRLAVQADVERFRAAFFNAEAAARCPVYGSPLTPGDSHVHHEGPRNAFSQLVKLFVRENRVRLASVDYLAGRFVDAKLRDAFAAFHAEHAKLVVVSRAANQSALQRQPR